MLLSSTEHRKSFCVAIIWWMVLLSQLVKFKSDHCFVVVSWFFSVTWPYSVQPFDCYLAHIVCHNSNVCFQHQSNLFQSKWNPWAQKERIENSDSFLKWVSGFLIEWEINFIQVIFTNLDKDFCFEHHGHITIQLSSEVFNLLMWDSLVLIFIYSSI